MTDGNADVSQMTPAEKLSLLSVLKVRSGKGNLSASDKALAAELGVKFPNDPNEWVTASKTIAQSLSPKKIMTAAKQTEPIASTKLDGSKKIALGADTATSSAAAASSTYNPTKSDSDSSSQPGDKLTTTFEQVGIAQGRRLAVGGTSWSKTAPTSTGSSSSFKADTLADAVNYAAMKLVSLPSFKNGTSRLSQGFTARAVPDYSEKTFLDQIVEMAYETSGAGSQETQMGQVFSRLDRFGKSMAPRNSVFSGYTFFTRPRLCLKDWNIVTDRKLAALKTTDVLSIPFAIRCYLDTQYASDSDSAKNCPLFDRYNPFLVPLCNAVKSISGFNDPTLVTETTEGGFFSEDQTYVIGGDRLARTYDINCSFRDYPGSPILAIIDYWCQYMANLTDGSMQQYSDAIDANRIDYTISIYRFLMDRTNRNITRWCKCTGCYPVSPPSGVTFNLNEGEFMVNAAAELNVPFKVNRIEYDDPVILKEFNILVRRYGGSVLFGSGKVTAFDQLPQNNFSGIPYIRPGSNGYEMVWLQRQGVAGEYSIADADNDVSDIKKSTGASGTVQTTDTSGTNGKAVL